MATTSLLATSSGGFDWAVYLAKFMEPDRVTAIMQAVVILCVGLLLIRAIDFLLRTRLAKYLSVQQVMLFRKAVSYVGTFLLFVTILGQLGFNVAAILGAAGVLGVAIGFASQTAMSNLISGIFLVFERPFSVGDAITVGATTGVVMSVDLLSVKLRRFDNQFVRIPNSTLISTEVINITRFPIRRADITVGVSYADDLDAAAALLKRIALEHPDVLVEPEPVIRYTGFNASSQDILFGVWVEKDKFFSVRNEVTATIRREFMKAGIEIPYPRLTISTSNREEFILATRSAAAAGEGPGAEKTGQPSRA